MKKAPQLAENGKRKFGMRDKVAYAAGDFGCNMSFALKGTVQTFWLVFMMMETGLLSILLLVVQIRDAVNAPMIGSMIDADRRQYKMGKFKTYIFAGACGLLVAGAAVFLPFPNAPVVLKAILFVLGYIIWDACYTVANVPYGSMLPLVTDNKVEQAELSTWRSIGSMVGGMIPGVLLPMLRVTYDGTTDFLSKIADIMESKRGKLWFMGVGLKIKKRMDANKKGQKSEKKSGGFSVLRLSSMMGMMNVSFTKEELLKMNKQLSRIKKPKKK